MSFWRVFRTMEAAGVQNEQCEYHSKSAYSKDRIHPDGAGVLESVQDRFSYVSTGLMFFCDD